MSTFRIGQVAELANVRTSTIRYYEARGLLPEPARVGGRHVYDHDVLDRLSLIRLAQKAGFTLSEIGRLISIKNAGARPAAIWSAGASFKIAETERDIARLHNQRRILNEMLACQCSTIGECVSRTDSLGSTSGINAMGEFY